jgi:cation diffusion facilitator CzcD-associated flavoprotein CzcO
MAGEYCVSNTGNESRRLTLEEIKAKYRTEREKRLRPEGTDQYRSLAGVFDEFDRDPYADPNYQRAPVIEETDVAIIGGGLGGLMAAVELTKQGITDFRIIDKAGDFGGTWYWNRYPGAACDIESYIYLPFLEETGYIPVERYSRATEIFEHCQRIARQFDLYPKGLFQTVVRSARWIEAVSRWEVATARGDRIQARFMIVAGGILHKAKLPGIPGIETFKGKSFHTGRWDYGYTGGGPTEPMIKLADKRVALIGTGATAVQVMSKLAETTQQLFVFQRTPSGVGERLNRPTDPEWAKSLRPGWHKARVENFTRIVSGQPVDRDLIGDGWTEIFGRNPNAFGVVRDEERLLDFEAMEAVRARIDKIVTDPDTAAALKPWYNQMCKRPCFHDEYLPAFNRPNVTLIDTNGKGVERITEDAVVVDGVSYPVDCIVYASGFEVGSSHTSRLGFEIYGRAGVSLTDAWADGPATLQGMFARGFPNYMSFYLLQGGIAINFAHLLSELAIHAAWLIALAKKTGIEQFEPSAAAQEAWLQTLIGRLGAQAAFFGECTPGYSNGEGRMPTSASAIRSIPFFGPTLDFVQILRDWRAAGDLAGLETRHGQQTAG